jgi:hypothetical protein
MLSHYDDMTSSPERVAILLPVSVAMAMTFCTVIIHALPLIPILHFLRYELRLRRAGVLFWRDVGIVAGVTLVALAAHLIAVAAWALVFTFCGVFSQLAVAFYHSGMNYTTLGDSEKVMSLSWRLLAPLEAANGMLMFGVSTAMLFAVIQRLSQIRFSEPSNYET